MKPCMASESGDDSSEDTPLPIPNREVKLTGADGTAIPGGRVGNRRLWGSVRQKCSDGTPFLCSDAVR